MNILGMSAELNGAQLADLKKAVAALDMPKRQRQRFIWRMAKYGVIPAAKRNVRNQRAPDGTPWQARKTRRRGKMLRNLPGLLHIREMPEIEAVRLYLSGGGYRNGSKHIPAGVVGYAHQTGMQIRARAGKPRPQPANRLATLAQAKKLRALGYRVKRGRRWRRPTFREITGTMHYVQAGLLIRKLSGKVAKSAWVVNVPARPFVGMSSDDFNKALARQLQAIGYGWYVRAQDIGGSV